MPSWVYKSDKTSGIKRLYLEYLSYGHKVMRIFDVSPKFLFTISQPKPDY